MKNELNNPPIVLIEKMELIENNYVTNGKKWSTLKLIEYSKNFEPFDLPLAGINLGTPAWGIENMDDFIFHVKRLEEVNVIHPILLDDIGQICDGWHRIIKAILSGNTTIKAIRLNTMPDPDKTE